MDRREAVAEALASVRAEGLEPTSDGLVLIEAWVDDGWTAEAVVERLLQLHREERAIDTFWGALGT